VIAPSFAVTLKPCERPAMGSEAKAVSLVGVLADIITGLLRKTAANGGRSGKHEGGRQKA
jgi:hypothetical protein